MYWSSRLPCGLILHTLGSLNPGDAHNFVSQVQYRLLLHVSLRFMVSVNSHWIHKYFDFHTSIIIIYSSKITHAPRNFFMIQITVLSKTYAYLSLNEWRSKNAPNPGLFLFFYTNIVC